MAVQHVVILPFVGEFGIQFQQVRCLIYVQDLRLTFSPCQVFYYLGELNEALTYALCAANLFDVAEESEYVQTLICESFDIAQK